MHSLPGLSITSGSQLSIQTRACPSKNAHKVYQMAQLGTAITEKLLKNL